MTRESPKLWPLGVGLIEIAGIAFLVTGVRNDDAVLITAGTVIVLASAAFAIHNLRRNAL